MNGNNTELRVISCDLASQVNPQRKNTKFCNVCGKPLDIFDFQEEFRLQRSLGYGTKYDGEYLDIRLCCDCMDELIDKCVISPISHDT